MKTTTKIFYDIVIDTDLFFTIYDYLRFNSSARHDYKIDTTDDFDNLSYEDWIYLAHDTLKWLKEVQLPKVCSMENIEISPTAETWGTLYYQTLNYMAIKDIRESIYRMPLSKLIKQCEACIEYLKSKINEMREPTGSDI